MCGARETNNSEEIDKNSKGNVREYATVEKKNQVFYFFTLKCCLTLEVNTRILNTICVEYASSVKKEEKTTMKSKQKPLLR